MTTWQKALAQGSLGTGPLFYQHEVSERDSFNCGRWKIWRAHVQIMVKVHP